MGNPYYLTGDPVRIYGRSQLILLLPISSHWGTYHRALDLFHFSQSTSLVYSVKIRWLPSNSDFPSRPYLQVTRFYISLHPSILDRFPVLVIGSTQQILVDLLPTEIEGPSRQILTVELGYAEQRHRSMRKLITYILYFQNVKYKLR
jgi:hypothetical protein